MKDGLLRRGEITGRDWGEDPERVDYGRIYEHRFEVLRLAYARGKEKLAEELAAFRQENAAWLEDYALFMAVKRSFGMVSWVEWPDEAIRLHKPEAVDQYRRELADDVDFWCFLQFLFFRQWKALRAYAHEKIPSLRACESYRRETRNRRIMMFLNYHGLEQLGQWILRVKSGIA